LPSLDIHPHRLMGASTVQGATRTDPTTLFEVRGELETLLERDLHSGSAGDSTSPSRSAASARRARTRVLRSA